MLSAGARAVHARAEAGDRLADHRDLAVELVGGRALLVALARCSATWRSTSDEQLGAQLVEPAARPPLALVREPLARERGRLGAPRGLGARAGELVELVLQDLPPHRARLVLGRVRAALARPAARARRLASPAAAASRFASASGRGAATGRKTSSDCLTSPRESASFSPTKRSISCRSGMFSARLGLDAAERAAIRVAAALAALVSMQRRQNECPHGKSSIGVRSGGAITS